MRARRLSAEIDTAAAMMALMKTSRESDLIRNYQKIALRSYKSAMDLLAVTTLSPKAEQELLGRLAPIKGWLEAEGLLFDIDGGSKQPG